MDTRRTPRGTAAVPQSSPEKPKGKRPAATETTAEEIVVGRRTRSKAAHSDAEPEKSVLNASGLEDSGDESPADNSNLEKTKQPRRSLRNRKGETVEGSGDEAYSTENIASDGGQPGRYKCPDCVKSFAFAGSFFMHRKEHLKCKKCGEEFQTEAGLSDHNRKCEYDVAESPSKADVELNETARKRRRVSENMTETGETARKVQPEKLVDQSSNVVGSGGAHTEHNLTCGETLGDSPEPNMEDPANTIGFAPGSEPPAIPLVEGTSGMDHQLLSGTDTPELPEEHVEGSSNKDKRKKGGEEDVVEICRVLKKTPVVDSSATKKSFVCSHCGLSFRTKDGLAVHMEQHESGELEGFVDERDKQAAACTLCDQMFTTPDELDEHLVKSHNIKLNVSGLSQSSSTKKGFKCAYCDTLVAGKHELNTHVKKVHFGFKYYSCPMCNKSLRDANSLNFHIKWVHMAEKFDCPLCPRAFRSEEGLRNHLVGNHTKTFDPRLFGLEVTDDKEPKLRRRGMRSVPIIRRRKPNGPGGSSTGTQLAVGTAMTNQADIIAPINSEFGVQEEVISPDGTPGSEMENRFYPRCDASGLPLKGSGLINGRKYKFIRTVGDTKLFYDKKGEIIGTEVDAAKAKAGEDQCDSPTPSTDAERESTSKPYKEEKLKISNVRIKIMSF